VSACFILSLDFELLWGVRDSRGREYQEQLLAVHKVIPELLCLFEKYEIACTWATVGALCLPSIAEFELMQPETLPSYSDSNFSPYPALSNMSQLGNELLFAPDLINQIIQSPKQELASHTFCHYYCLEQGQTVDQFKMDLQSNAKVASKLNTAFKSIVFPRNQFNQDYLKACAEAGIVCYRGNPSHWAYQAESREKQSMLRRAFRLIDAYLPLSGSLRQKIEVDEKSGLVNVPASLFLRPWSNKARLFEKLRLWRIKWSMTRAAKKGGVFHLWWHPHNFGSNTEQNLKFLEEILKHYQFLNKECGFKSATMIDAALQEVRK
jgi:hypothetical protein